MQATGLPVHLTALAWAAPLAALGWSLAAGRASAGRPVSPFRSLLPAAAAAAAAAFLTAAGAQWAVRQGGETGPSGPVWTQIAIGALAFLLGLAAAAAILRGGGSEDEDGWTGTDAAVAAVAVPALLGAYLMVRHTARPAEWLSVSPLGAAVVAASAAMFVRGMAGPAGAKRTLEALEALAAGCAAVAFGILLGKLHYAGRFERAGDLTPLFLAASLGIWLVLSVAQRLAFRDSRALSALWGVAYTGFAAWSAWLLAGAVHAESAAASCLWAGLGAGGAAVLLGLSGALDAGSPQSRTARLVSAAAVLGAGALSLRLQTGFGLALCAAGLLAALPLRSLLTPWMSSPSRRVFPFPVVWGAGYLAAWCALRIWLEWHGAAYIPASSPYVFLGLSAGMALPFILASMAAGQEEAPSPAGAAAGALVLPVTLAAVVLLVSIVLREPSVRLFLLGCGAAGLALPFAAAAMPAIRSAAPVVSGGLAAVCLTLVTSGALQQWSEEATRPGKVRVLAAAFAVLVVCYIVLEALRLKAAREASGEGRREVNARGGTRPG